MSVCPKVSMHKPGPSLGGASRAQASLFLLKFGGYKFEKMVKLVLKLIFTMGLKNPKDGPDIKIKHIISK